MIEVWNLEEGVRAVAGAQDPFNIVGRVADPASLDALEYRLNGGRPQGVAFNGGPGPRGRLQRPGDFSIDTIDLGRLGEENQLVLLAHRRSGGREAHALRFGIKRTTREPTRFDLDLEGARHVAEVGQVVEGRWRLGETREGESCLEIKEEDAGYDRIILFGDRRWTTGYQIHTTFTVRRWTHRWHNVGCVFKWNPHEQGDGRKLPTTWNTGLGYFYSRSPGLRLRYGTGVHHDAQGRKVGDHVLAERPFSPVRHLLSRGRNRLRPEHSRPWSQLRCDRAYELRVVVHRDEYRLTLWLRGRPEPAAQLRVPQPLARLETGAVGFIALNAAVQVHAYSVSPYPPSGKARGVPW